MIREYSACPVLSIVIPVTRIRAGLERCLNSVETAVKPLERKIEVVVKYADDLYGSIPKDLRARFDFVPCTRVEMDQSWNQCWRLAVGRYVHILHDDDYVRPQIYTRIWPLLEADPTAVCTGYEVEENGIYTFENRVKRDGSDLLESDLALGNCLVPSCIIIRKNFYEMHGGYDGLGGTNCLDWDLYLRLAQQGPIKVSPDFSVVQTRSEDSQALLDTELTNYTALMTTIKRWELKNTLGYPRMPARSTYATKCLAAAITTKDVRLFELACEMRGDLR